MGKGCNRINSGVNKKEEILVSTAIFLDRDLAPLEAMAEFLKEKNNYSYHEIAFFVGRDDRTIWTCYSRAKKKRAKKDSNSENIKLKQTTEEFIPVSIFKNRTLAPLEAITKYLKEEKNLSFHEIAVLVNRNDRTIWTCYSRSKKKCAEVKQ